MKNATMKDPIATCNQEDQLHMLSPDLLRNQRRTLAVVILTFFVMIVEIAFGYWTGSMALLADGYHMASHVGALGLSYLVYQLAQSRSLQARLNFGTGKLLPLGGYTSAVVLGLMAVWMVFESVLRFLNPEVIHFKEALWVSVLGLVTNLVSAWLLGWKNEVSGPSETSDHGHAHQHHDHDHHDHEHDHHDHDHHHHDHNSSHEHPHHGHQDPVFHSPSHASHNHGHSHREGHNHGHGHDHNHESALAHVLADALTSVMAVVALLVGSLYGLNWVDPAMGLVGAVVIIKWSYNLCRRSAWELLDGSVSEINSPSIQNRIRAEGVNLHDFHLWKTGPRNFVCIVSLTGSSDSIREKIRTFFPVGIKLHLIVENRD